MRLRSIFARFEHATGADITIDRDCDRRFDFAVLD